MIDPAFQWKYAAIITIIVFTLSALASFVLYGMLCQQARMRLVNPETYTAPVAPVILLSALVFAAMTAAGVGGWWIVVTHRICGPLFVVQGYLTEISQGRLPKPRSLRRKDEIRDFYATFTKAVESLREARRAELRMLTSASEAAQRALDADKAASNEALQAVVDRVESLRLSALQTLGEDAPPADPPISKHEQVPRMPVAVS